MTKDSIHRTVTLILFSNLIAITIVLPLLRGESLGLTSHLLPTLLTGIVLGSVSWLLRPAGKDKK